MFTLGGKFSLIETFLVSSIFISLSSIQGTGWPVVLNVFVATNFGFDTIVFAFLLNLVHSDFYEG